LPQYMFHISQHGSVSSKARGVYPPSATFHRCTLRATLS
jgi:hypothetical protein